MARIDFGHTWWGRRWLESLAHIDYENRLPRGKRYARNRSVRSIDVNGPEIQAKVQGTRPSPYTVKLTLWTFSAAQQNTVVNLVRDDPYYMSQLEARILPPELDQALADQQIRLFPASWKELGMRCSCPDWAVPCKHLAAVVYIIANEIDKNPFLVFRMHGMDLLEAIHGSPVDDDEQIVDIESLVAGEEQEYNYYREHLEHLDLATIPDLYPATSRLLTEFPLFYLHKDFKELLLGAIRKSAREATRYVKNLELQEQPPKTLYTTCSLTIHKGRHHVAGKLKKGRREISFDSDNFEPLVEYLQRLSAGDLAVYPPVISFLIMVHNFVLRMLEQRALVPEIIALKKGSYIVRWIPALFNEEIKTIFDALVEALPREIVRYGSRPLEHREQTLFLISFFLQYYLAIFDPVADAAAHPVTALFFCGAEYVPSRFEERENARTIHLWLGRFFMRPIHHYPVLHVEENSDGSFAFEIRVSDRREDDELPMPFSGFLQRPEKETLPLLRDLSLLSTYLGTVNTFLKQRGAVTVPADEFIEQWFGAIPALRTLGVRTVVPKALRQSFQPHLSLAIRANTAGRSDSVVSYTSLQQMLDVDWRVAVGDDFVPAEQLFELSGRYRRFVRYKDRFIELDETQLNTIARRMESAPRPKAIELLQMGLTGTFDGAPIEMAPEAKELFRQLLNPPEADVPDRLDAELRPYQVRGYRWLYHNYRIGIGSVVADDMGLGKTIQVIALLLRLQEEGALTFGKPALVVVPASLVTNWEREIRRFGPSLSPGVYHGSGRAMPTDADVILTTYALVRGDRQQLKKPKWLLAIIDEAQNIKNSTSGQTQAVKALKAEYFIAMTGTPVENRLLDYWSIVDFVMKGYLGSRSKFKERYAVPIERYRDQHTLERFRTVSAPLILRRLKTDRSIIQDLPEKLVTNRYPLLTGEQTVLYRELVENTEAWLAETEGIERSGAVFKLMTGLKQICCHPRLYVKRGSTQPAVSGKAVMLLELLSTITERSEKALVFTQFAEMGFLLQEMIEAELGSACLFLHGGSTRKERDTMVDQIQNDPEFRVMVLSIRAGGVGLNLTAANHVIHYDLWWNPAVENQATDRAFRIGQRKDVSVYRLITRGTFEEKINTMLEAKEELADLTVAQGEQWLTKLNTSEIKELISLTADA